MESRKMVPWTYSQSRSNLFLYTTTILQFVSQHGQYSCQTGSSLQCSAFISLSSILWKSMWNRYKKCEEPSLTTIKICAVFVVCFKFLLISLPFFSFLTHSKGNHRHHIIIITPNTDFSVNLKTNKHYFIL